MSQSQSHFDRRKFIQYVACSATSILIFPALNKKSLGALAYADAPTEFKPLSEEDPVAKSLGYKANADKVDVKKWPKRAGAAGKEQYCHNCMFYTDIDKKQGKCQIFQNKTVNHHGWCNTWSKKP